MKKYLFCVLLLISVFFLCGFDSQSSWTVAGDQDNTVQILAGQVFGQSFTSLHAGLDSISINITPPDGESNRIIVRLYENSLDRQLISEEAQIIAYEPEKIFYRIDLPLQRGSYLKDYFIEIEWGGDQSLTIITEPAESYDQGAFYLGDSPVEAQLGFILHYDPFYIIIGLASQSLLWLWHLVLTSLVFIVPGWAFLLLTWNSWKKYDLLIKTAMASAVSLAIYPLLMLLTDLLGFHPGEIIYVWVPVITGSGYLIWRTRGDWQRINELPKSFLAQIKRRFKSQFPWLNLTTFILVLLVIVLRLWIVRTLEVPLWGDSYQHTVITQLILDNKGLFESWLPYAPYESLSIHFGFHVNSAIFAWISHSSASYAVIWVGQIANIFVVLALYPLALRLTRNNKWMGCCVMFVGGLLLQLPLYYVNWGRYPQLLASGLLLIAFFMLLETLFSNEKGIKKIIVCSIVLAGMTLSYYRSPFFMLIFLPSLIVEVIRWKKHESTKNNAWIWQVLLLVGFSALLLLPLLPRLSQGELVNYITTNNASSLLSKVNSIIFSWRSVTNYYNKIFLVLAALAIFLSIFQKQWHIFLVPFGILLIQSYSLGSVINLPFSNFFDVFTILILLFIPLSILIGHLTSQTAKLLSGFSTACPALIIIFLSFLLTYSSKNIIDTHQYGYVTRADQRAFEWIKANTEETAKFLVDGFNTWNNTSSVGSDGGWWISLLAERSNTMPPQYALLNEKPIDPNYTKDIVEIIDIFSRSDPTSEEGISALCMREISHIYIGQKGGMVNQAQPLLTWQNWIESSTLEPVYEEDRVKIYAFNRTVCE